MKDLISIVSTIFVFALIGLYFWIKHEFESISEKDFKSPSLKPKPESEAIKKAIEYLKTNDFKIEVLNELEIEALSENDTAALEEIKRIRTIILTEQTK